MKKIITLFLLSLIILCPIFAESADAATLFYAKTGRENLKVYVTATTTKNKLTNTQIHLI